MKEIRYGVREIATKKIVMRYFHENDAIQFCGRLNRRYNEEKFEIVKIVTTVEIEEVAQKGDKTMTVDKIIKILTEMKEKYGDIEVSVYNEDLVKVHYEYIEYDSIKNEVEIWQSG